MPGSTSDGWRPSGQSTQFVCDIASFGDERRGDDARARVRAGLYAGLRTAFTAEGVSLDGCYREDRGDGALVVLPPDVDTALLLTSVAYRLRGEVRRHNAYSSEAVRFRLRVAVNTGEVHWDGEGLVGTALNHAFRILDAEPFKEVLRASGADLALIVTPRVYDDVVKQGRGLLDRQDYRRLEIKVKELEGFAWVTLPGLGAPPSVPDGPAGAANGAGEVVPVDEATAPAEVGDGSAEVRDGAVEGPAGGWLYEGRDVPPEVLFELVDYALAIPQMAGERERERVVAALPLRIAGVIPRSFNARSDTYEIIRTCLDYPGGLQALLAALGGFVGESLAFTEFKRAVVRFLYGD
ncbi:effector-associated domain 2-containing protein [Spirillospora sp. CA-255316]